MMLLLLLLPMYFIDGANWKCYKESDWGMYDLSQRTR